MIERVRHEMERLGLNARTLSDKANLGRSFVYDLLSGKSCNPTAKKLSALAEALGVSLPYLVSGLSNDNTTYSKDENFVAIQHLKSTSLSAEKNLYRKYLFHQKWLAENIGSKPENLQLVTINDSAMYPTLLRNDNVLVDTSINKPDTPGIFILVSGISTIARRLEYMPDKNLSEVLISQDSNPSILYSCPIQDISIIGRIMWFARRI